MANTVYISAGLPVAKSSGQSPTADVNTVYVSAGLPPEVQAAAPATTTVVPVVHHERPSQRPNHFTIDPSHHLANGLVFAGLGAHAGSAPYYDSSARRQDATTDENNRWGYANSRRLLSLDPVAGETVRWASSPLDPTEPRPCTISTWFRADSNSISRHSLFTNNNSLSPRLYLHLDQISGSTYVQELYSNTYATDSNQFTLNVGEWVHYSFTWDTADNVGYYRNGVANGTAVLEQAGTGADGAAIGSLRPVGWSSFYSDGDYQDFIIHNRILSPSEISQLADPSNVMLSGLIQPPVRRWFAVGGDVAPATFQPAWASYATTVAI
jgi:hypothetical protein